jgi:hypothetical protein
MAIAIWIAIAVVVLVAIGLVAWGMNRKHRRDALVSHFGSEYDRAVARTGDSKEAEAELRGRLDRREEFELRPLDRAQREKFSRQWTDIQARFVDDPTEAVGDADRLLDKLMHARGYPAMSDSRERADVLSVDHPDSVEHYRLAAKRRRTNGDGPEQTESLREAMVHYRTMIVALLDEGQTTEVRR